MATQLALWVFPSAKRLCRTRDPGIHSEIVNQAISRKRIQVFGVGSSSLKERPVQQAHILHRKWNRAHGNTVLPEARPLRRRRPEQGNFGCRAGGNFRHASERRRRKRGTHKFSARKTLAFHRTGTSCRIPEKSGSSDFLRPSHANPRKRFLETF